MNICKVLIFVTICCSVGVNKHQPTWALSKEKRNIILATYEEEITLFNGTFNSTQVLHKAGGIGVEQETTWSFTYTFTSNISS